MPDQITPADALETLANAAAQYRGTLQEHQVIQQCVQVLQSAITPQEPDKDETHA